jgi:hypothetical protein
MCVCFSSCELKLTVITQPFSQQRYGLAFKMEHGFQRTEMGRQAYTMNLAIITQAVLRTVYARVMQVLVQNRNWLAVVAAKTFPSSSVQAREISKASVNSFGAIQVDRTPFPNTPPLTQTDLHACMT